MGRVSLRHLRPDHSTVTDLPGTSYVELDSGSTYHPHGPQQNPGWLRGEGSSLGFLLLLSHLPVGNKGPGSPFSSLCPLEIGHVASSLSCFLIPMGILSHFLLARTQPLPRAQMCVGWVQEPCEPRRYGPLLHLSGAALLWGITWSLPMK